MQRRGSRAARRCCRREGSDGTTCNGDDGQQTGSKWQTRADEQQPAAGDSSTDRTAAGVEHPGACEPLHQPPTAFQPGAPLISRLQRPCIANVCKHQTGIGISTAQRSTAWHGIPYHSLHTAYAPPALLPRAVAPARPCQPVCILSIAASPCGMRLLPPVTCLTTTVTVHSIVTSLCSIATPPSSASPLPHPPPCCCRAQPPLT